MSSSQRKGSLSYEEIEQREAYCQMVKHNFEKRKKEACLKSLLKPTSTSFFRVRPTDEEVKSKIVRERI